MQQQGAGGGEANTERMKGLIKGSATRAASMGIGSSSTCLMCDGQLIN